MIKLGYLILFLVGFLPQLFAKQNCNLILQDFYPVANLEIRTAKEHHQILSLSNDAWHCKADPNILYQKIKSSLFVAQDLKHRTRYLKIAEKAIQHYQKYVPKVDSISARIYRMEGNLHWENEKVWDKFDAYSKAVALVHHVKNPIERINIYLALGIAHESDDTQQNALINLLSLKILATLQDIPLAHPERNRFFARAYLFRGDFLKRLKNRGLSTKREALKNFERARVILQRAKHTREFMEALYSIALLKADIHADAKAGLSHMKLAFMLAQKQEDPFLLDDVKQLYGRLLWQSGNIAMGRTLLKEAIQTHLYPQEALLNLGLLEEIAENLPLAEHYFLRSIKKAEQKQQGLFATEWIYEATAAERFAYRGLTRVYKKQGNLTAAFKSLEASRGLSLHSMRHQFEQLGQLSQQEREQVDSLFHIIQVTKKSKSLDSLLINVQAELHKQQIFAEHFAKYQKAKSLTVPKKSLNENIIVYFIDSKEAKLSPRKLASFAFILRKDQLLCIDLPGARQHVPNFSPTSNYELSAKQLYKNLFEPLHPHLKSHRIGVVADSFNQKIPLESFLYQDRFLVSTFHFRYAPSVQYLNPSYIKPFSAKSLSAFGISDFNFSKDPLPHLTQTTNEINTLAQHFQRYFYQNNAATETQFIKSLSYADQVLHVSTHAIYTPSNPLNSILYLHPDPENDGLLSLVNLYGKRISNPLIFLSACQTASGTEGAKSLHLAFMASGANTIISSFWNTEDHASSQIAISFYKFLNQTQSIDKALQKAKLAYLKTASPLHKNPFYWATLNMFGANQVFTIQPKSPIAL